jgi:hypothetical protein
VLDSRFLGYKKLKDSPNPVLREKAAYYARELRYAYPVFLPGRLLGPNRNIRQWIGQLERDLHAELGKPTWPQRFKSIVAVGAALWTAVKLKFNLFEHPKLQRTAYRIPGKRWNAFQLWESFQTKTTAPGFSIQVELQHAKQQVWLRLEGALSRTDVEGLSRRIRDSLAQSKARLILDMNKLHVDKMEDLQHFRENLAAYRSRIRIVLPPTSSAHAEWLLLTRSFTHY